jgi:hypothetical protein
MAAVLLDQMQPLALVTAAAAAETQALALAETEAMARNLAAVEAVVVRLGLALKVATVEQAAQVA